MKQLASRSNDLRSKPIVSQMTELQRVGVVLAKDQEKLSESRYQNNAHIFNPYEVQTIEDTNGTGGFWYTRHAFTGRIARIGHQVWSMRLAESFGIRGEYETQAGRKSVFEAGYRHSYLFCWSKEQVEQAQKLLHATRLPRDDFRSQPEYLVSLLKEADFVAATIEAENVSFADCELLLNDLSAFCDASHRARSRLTA